MGSQGSHSPQRPGFDPEDVLKRLDDLTRRVEKLEEEMRSLKLVLVQSTTGGNR